MGRRTPRCPARGSSQGTGVTARREGPRVRVAPVGRWGLVRVTRPAGCWSSSGFAPSRHCALVAWVRSSTIGPVSVGPPRRCVVSGLLRGVDVAGAPGVEGVVDEAGAFQEALVVGFDVQPADTDEQNAPPGRVTVQILGDV